MKLKKVDVIKFIVIAIISCLIYSPIIIGHYSTDTYRLIEMGYKKYSIEYSLNDGRIFMSIIGQIADKLNTDIMVYVIILTALAIFISCICVIILERIITKYKRKEKIIVSLLISYITIMNFMWLENMYFTENIVMAISILLYLLAAYYLNEGKSKIKVFLLVLLGMFCYQGTINAFISFYFVFALIKNKKINKQICKDLFSIILICLVSVAINMLQIKICGKIYGLEQTRTGGIEYIFYNIIYIFEHMDKIILYSSEMFPKYLFLVFLLTILIVIAIWDKKKNGSFTNIKNVILITLIAIASSVSINVVSLSSYGLARMVFSVGALIGLIYVYLYCSTDLLEEKTIYKKIMMVILTIYIVTNVINTLNILISHREANKLDKQEALKVNEYIDEYEKENNIEVKYIAVAYDSDITWTYNEVKHKSLYTHRALMIWWCNVDAINYYGNRKLQRVQMYKDTYEKYFEGKNWDKLDKEQFVFEGNTLYYCVY